MNIGQILAVVNDNKYNIKLCGIAFAITLFFSGFIQSILINTCIFGYLSFNTIRFLKNFKMDALNDLELRDDIIIMHNLLKHWTCISALMITEYFLSTIFSFMFMSLFYNTIKMVSLILLLQNENNLMLIYELAVLPLFNMYEQYMELGFNALEEEAKKFKVKSKGLQEEEVNYNLYKYIEPYVNKVKSFVSTTKVEKK